MNKTLKFFHHYVSSVLKNKKGELLLWLTKLGKNSEKIANYLNAINAHDILDSMAYRQ